MATFKRIRAKLEARREALGARIADLRGHRALGGLPAGPEALRARWDGSDLAWRREVVGLLVERAVINPGRRGLDKFDGSRVDIVPRTGVEQKAS